MGTYVYSARATGRKQVTINGNTEWCFPLVFEYKSNGLNTPQNWVDKAIHNAERTEARDDWSGLVLLHGQELWRVPSAFVVDSELTQYRGDL